MRVVFITILLLLMQSCASKKYTKIRSLPDGIKSATEEKYVVENNKKKLLYKKQMVFTKNGRIKYSKTVDSLGNLLQETEKRLWFVVELYPDKESYYCKTRWKTKQRERISCYTKKQYKENEAIYHYNPDSAELHSVPTKKILSDTQDFFFNTRHYKTYKRLKINIIAIQNIVSLFWLAL